MVLVTFKKNVKNQVGYRHTDYLPRIHCRESPSKRCNKSTSRMLSTAGGATALLYQKGDMRENACALIDYRQQCVTVASAAPSACGLKTFYPAVDRPSDSARTSPSVHLSTSGHPRAASSAPSSTSSTNQTGRGLFAWAWLFSVHFLANINPILLASI